MELEAVDDLVLDFLEMNRAEEESRPRTRGTTWCFQACTIAPTAIAEAQAKAQERELTARFLVQNALSIDHLGETFDVVLDCGFFHVLSDDDRMQLAEVLRQIMTAGSEYHLLCFIDRVPGDDGPRRVRQDEIRSAFKDGFSVETIRESYIEATFLADPIPAWSARIVGRSSAN